MFEITFKNCFNCFKMFFCRIHLSDIKIENLEGDSVPLAAVVANLVALCSKEGDLFNVHGYGMNSQ